VGAYAAPLHSAYGAVHDGPRSYSFKACHLDPMAMTNR